MMSSFWALSLVPIKDTIQAFETLAIHCGDEEQAVLDYFDPTTQERRVTARMETTASAPTRTLEYEY